MRTATTLTDALASRPLVLDGATGTGLMALAPDVDPALGLERLCADAPGLVRGLHEQHLRAGCDLVRTNTFCGSERDLSRRAAELSSAAIESLGASPRHVLGVVGPGRGRADETSMGALVDAERDRAAGLAEGGVDAILVETVTSLRRARAAAVAAADVASDLPVFVSCTVGADGRLLDGSDLVEFAAFGREHDAALLALNCAAGPASLDGPLAALRSAWDGPIGAWPNAGLPKEIDGALTWPLAPADLAAWCEHAVRRFDLRIVGGCCGTTAEHVGAVKDALTSEE